MAKGNKILVEKMTEVTAEENIVETTNLVKFYGKKCVVYNLNLSVPKGGIFGFLGPNGAGKSTTIKMLLGLLRPTSGQIKIFGKNLKAARVDILKRVGYLPEKPILYEKMTVLQFVTFMARLHGVKKNPKKRALEMLDFFGVGKHILSQCRELSAGQRQRVGLAQAFVHDPEFIILDEPTTNLDPLGRMQIFEKLRYLVEEENKTIFISSHILPEIERLCDYVGVINQGTLVASGSLGEIIAKTVNNEFVIVVDRPNILMRKIGELPYILQSNEKDYQVIVSVDPEHVKAFVKDVMNIIMENDMLLKSFKPLYMPIEKMFIDALGIRSKSELENVME